MELHGANVSARGHTKAAFQKESFRQWERWSCCISECFSWGSQSRGRALVRSGAGRASRTSGVHVPPPSQPWAGWAAVLSHLGTGTNTPSHLPSFRGCILRPPCSCFGCRTQLYVILIDTWHDSIDSTNAWRMHNACVQNAFENKCIQTVFADSGSVSCQPHCCKPRNSFSFHGISQ